MTNVFIDGSAGTTGLRIHDRLKKRKDVKLISIEYEKRHDIALRRQAINEADIAFLCLPDEASIESVSLIDKQSSVVVIDTSTAHRVSPNWVYGFPELAGEKDSIRAAKRIANPGCHASGFIVLVQPLVKAKIISSTSLLTCYSLTGYSGGGKKMIGEYESANRKKDLDSPRIYGLNQNHKHLNEMKIISGLIHEPVFCPIVADYYSGMTTVVSLFKEELNGTLEQIKNVYKETYPGPVVHFEENDDEDGLISSGKYAGRDDMEIMAYGNSERITLISRFDNLGKGASGSAIQNMNIVMGIDETTGLNLGREIGK
jgi:N-acetyl-gamma-glutamyl-phosphate reductase